MSSRSAAPGPQAPEARGSRQSPLPGSPPEVVPFDFTSNWPANIPSTAYVHSFLTGKAQPPELLEEFNERFRTGLQLEELDTLVNDVDGSKAAIRVAILMTWRLRAALYVRPVTGGDVDPEGLDGLLAQADGALSMLKAVGSEGGDLSSFVSTYRDALAKLAVDVSTEATKVIPKVEAPKPAPLPKVTKVTPAKTDVQAPPDHVRVTVPVLVGVLLVAVGVGVGIFLLNRPGKPYTLPGAPVNSFTAGDLVHSVDGRPFDAEQLKQFEASLRPKGKTLQRLTPSTLRIVPLKDPAAASPTEAKAGPTALPAPAAPATPTPPPGGGK